jgi:hypothetical protein
MTRTFTHAPDAVLGYRKDGSPIHPIAGGSEAAPEAPAAPAEPVITVPEPTPPTPAQPEGPRFTAEDIAKARKEEKDKLYDRLTSAEEGWKKAQEEISSFKTLHEQEVAKAAEEAARAAEEEARKQWEEKDAKSLLEQVNAEWEQKFESLQQEQARKDALLEKEREFLSLQNYVQRRVTEEQGNIAPELLDYIGGNTPEEVEQSIATAIAKTNAIVDSIQAAQQQQRSQMRGVSTAGYSATGPMDTEPGQKSFSLEELQNMSAADYAKYRGSLLGAAASQRDRGLFG